MRQSLLGDVELDVGRFETWLQLRLDELVVQTRRREKLLKRRQKIAAALAFPFPSPRPGQAELIAALEEKLSDATLYAREPARFAALSAELAALRLARDADEERWLALEMEREALEQAAGD